MNRNVTYEQCNTLAQNWYEQATGQKSIAVVDTTTFTSVCARLNQLPYSQVFKGLREMLQSARFDIRPYVGGFRMAWKTPEEYGAYKRVLTKVEQKLTEDDPTYAIKTGDTFGTHKIKLPLFYDRTIWGANVLEASVTIAKKQVKTALRSQEEFAKFWAAVFTDLDNQLEQMQEGFARSTVLSFGAGKIYYDTQKMPGHVYHMITEYNTRFGKTYKNLSEVMKIPAEYTQFIKFCYAFLNTKVGRLANRDKLSHVNPVNDPAAKTDGGTGIILRNTPADKCHGYVLHEYLEDINTQVLSEVRNLEYLKAMKLEKVMFWQDIEHPDQISLTCKVMQEDGTTKDTGTVAASNLFAIIHDVDAFGCAMADEDVADTPMDAQKRVYNHYVHQDVESWVDYTQKGFVLLMDVAPL